MFKETPTDELLGPLARNLCKDREEAVKARKSSGVEEIWAKAREQFAGIDEVNRDRMSPVDGKSTTLDGPVRAQTTLGTVNHESRSTVFVNITRPYTMAGTARVADILLPTGKMPWDLQLSPRSDLQLIKAELQNYPIQSQNLLKMLPPDVGMRLVQDEESAKLAMEDAKLQIEDWLKECDWLAHVREQIIEAGKVGTGVLKGPFSKKREVSANVRMILDMLPFAFGDNIEAGLAAQKKLETQLLYSPWIECIKVENCYPAPGCGSDIQNGKYFFERVSDISKRSLEDLKEDPTYFAEQIDACLAEGPRGLDGKAKVDKNEGYDLWIRTGEVDLRDFFPDAPEKEAEEYACMFLTTVLCNGRIIKLDKPVLDSKNFHYRMLLWEPREDSWTGIGVPEQIETPQRGVNASIRSLMDNMGYSVGPQVLELEGLIEPIEGDDYQLRPYKRWRVKPSLPGISSTDEPLKAIQFLEFPNYLDQIMPVIQYWLKMAEDTTGLPLLLQGQASTDAVGVSQQLMNNSTTNLRLTVKQWDDRVCKPNIDDLYEWCQMHGPDSAKGDATAIALGSSTLLVKELQMQALLQIGDRVVQPIYGLSPSKWMRTFLEGFQIDYNNLELDDEERQKLEEAANAPDPKVLAAQIEAQANVMIAQIKDATDQLKVYVDAQSKGASILQARDAVDTQAQANITQEMIRQEGSKEQARLKGVESGVSKPKPSPAPKEMDTDSALNALGFTQ